MEKVSVFSCSPLPLSGTPRTRAPDFRPVHAVVRETVTTWLVLVFYPFDFTFICATEIESFRDNVERFRRPNAEVVAVSTDSHPVNGKVDWAK
ncbi:hypothetical protein PsorP6_016450 [Peronosclerospora sorghi]|uniref:Uncharacterized protein n=1 Tax=Peronosclerospora sorghi TaxID=230839 RepID=A0ACC0VP74_9STRA|nr:hypothetical protein PsorP6_016450 [Peronosclerospora sorghi]